MSMHIRKATAGDMPAVIRLEHACFPPAEAATQEKYAWRQQQYPDLFLVCETETGALAGCISMISMAAPRITDDVFETVRQPDGSVCAILTVMTDPALQRRGIAGQLLDAGIDVARRRGMTSIVLTCKAHLRHYYARFGFVEAGVSRSVHGGAVWYDMIQPL